MKPVKGTCIKVYGKTYWILKWKCPLCGAPNHSTHLNGDLKGETRRKICDDCFQFNEVQF